VSSENGVELADLDLGKAALYQTVFGCIFNFKSVPYLFRISDANLAIFFTKMPFLEKFNVQVTF
jgi:hypothetical protein